MMHDVITITHSIVFSYVLGCGVLRYIARSQVQITNQAKRLFVIYWSNHFISRHTLLQCGLEPRLTPRLYPRQLLDIMLASPCSLCAVDKSRQCISSTRATQQYIFHSLTRTFEGERREGVKRVSWRMRK